MIVQIIIIGILAAVLSLVIKKERPEIAVVISIAAGVIIVAMCYGDLRAIIETVKAVTEKSGIPGPYILTLLKIIGVAFLTEFAASIAKDAGETGIADKIQFAGKVFIVAITAPLFLALLNMITGLLI